MTAAVILARYDADRIPVQALGAELTQPAADRLLTFTFETPKTVQERGRYISG